MAFDVEIQVGLNDGTATIAAAGTAGTVSSDAEAAAFGLDQPTIKAIFERAWGRACSDGYRHDPVRGTNWYAQTGDTPVTTEHRVASAGITAITSTSFAAATQSCDNSAGSEPVSFDPRLTADVMNTIDSAMTPAAAVALAQSVDYRVSFAGTGGGGPSGYDFAQEWAASFHLESPDSYELSPPEPIIVPPGSTATATLLLTVGTMTIDIDYALDISGLVAGYYDQPLDHHHILFVDAVTGLRSLDMSTEIAATQTLTIIFHTDPVLQVTDGSGSAVSPDD